MPNRSSNNVIIEASIEKVKEYLIQTPNDCYAFNMRKLFPETFPEGDELGNGAWDYDWACDHTGSKWFPFEIALYDYGDAETQLIYDTARSPNNGTLQRLHELTGRTIRNEYEESGEAFEGMFTCRSGECWDEEREYQPRCEECDEKKPRSEFVESDDGRFCKECEAKRK